MLVKITRNTMAEGRPVKAGDVIDLADNEAGLLCRMNKAILHKLDAPEAELKIETPEGEGKPKHELRSKRGRRRNA